MPAMIWASTPIAKTLAAGDFRTLVRKGCSVRDAIGTKYNRTGGEARRGEIMVLNPACVASLAGPVEVADGYYLACERLGEFTGWRCFVLRFFSIGMLLASCVAASAQPIVYVNANAPRGGTGASWGTAYSDLEYALVYARTHPGVQIWVAEGTYTPGQGSTARTSTFLLPSGVSIIGGFAGRERTLDEREPAMHRTILSGDVGRDDWLDASNYMNNAKSVVTVLDAAANTVLRDLTITAGYGPDGAGVRIARSAVDFVGCEIKGNRGAREIFEPGRGGAGVSIGPGAGVTMRRCRFVGNSAALSAPAFGTGNIAGDGGAILCDASSLLLDACFFAENRAGPSAELSCISGLPLRGIPGGNGGALCLSNNASASVTNCVFEANRSGIGGVPQCCARGCDYNIGGLGAAIHIGPACVAIISHSTFAGNPTRSEVPDAVITGFNSSCSIEGSIIWDDAVQLNRHVTPWLAGTVRYSCIRGLTPSTDGSGNTGSDPLFAGGTMGGLPAIGMNDVALSPGSPCIDAASAPLANFADVDGVAMPRVMDNLDEPNRGVGTSGIPDMGALESTTAVIDSNGNGIPDSTEIASGAASDCDRDGVPDEAALRNTRALQLPTGSLTDGLGSSVSIDGDWLFAGSPSVNAGAGALVLFRRVASGWLPSRMVLHTEPGEGLGEAVSVSGNWAIIGVPRTSRQGLPATSGAVWIYRLVDGSWVWWQLLTAPDASTAARFGAAVAIAGDRGVVGAPGDSERGPGAGAVYGLDYDESASAWSVTRKITVQAFGAGAGLGTSVAAAVSPFGVLGVAGGPDHDGGRGGVIILRRRSAAWAVEGTLNGEAAGDRFGTSVATDGQRLCIGAPGHASGQGSAFLMGLAGSHWGVESAISGEPESHAGISVALAGSSMLVGNSAGITQYLESLGTLWRVHARTGPLGFGAALATDGAWCAAGAATGTGAVFAFPAGISDCNGNGIPDSCELAANPGLDQDHNGVIDDCQPCPVCIADFDRNGGIDGSDIGAFFGAWGDSLPCADANRDGGIDGADIETFIRRWEAGSCE